MSDRLPRNISAISTQGNCRSQRMYQCYYAMLFPDFHIVCRSLRAPFRIPCRFALFSVCGKDWILSPVHCRKMIQLVSLARTPECVLPKYPVERTVPLYCTNTNLISLRFSYARHFPIKILQLLLL